MKKYEWTKAQACHPNSACVEVMDDGFGMHVRDANDPDNTTLNFTYAEWEAFLAGVNAGEFDPHVD